MRQAGTFGRLCRVLTAICLLALTAGAAHAEGAQTEMFDRNTPIQTVIDDPAFGDYGRLLFPVDSWYYSGDTLGNLRLTWYSHINPDKTVEIVNTLRNRALNGETVFYDIYTESEKTADPTSATRACSSSRVRPARNSPCAMRAADSPMWARCTTVSRTHWSFRRRAITPSR